MIRKILALMSFGQVCLCGLLKQVLDRPILTGIWWQLSGATFGYRWLPLAEVQCGLRFYVLALLQRHWLQLQPPGFEQ